MPRKDPSCLHLSFFPALFFFCPTLLKPGSPTTLSSSPHPHPLIKWPPQLLLFQSYSSVPCFSHNLRDTFLHFRLLELSLPKTLLVPRASLHHTCYSYHFTLSLSVIRGSNFISPNYTAKFPENCDVSVFFFFLLMVSFPANYLPDSRQSLSF